MVVRDRLNLTHRLIPELHPKFTSVASVQDAHLGDADVCHAMVLDTYDADSDMLTFKNTYNDPESGQPKQFQIERTAETAPQEFYFVHIEIKDMEKLPDIVPVSKLRRLRMRH